MTFIALAIPDDFKDRIAHSLTAWRLKYPGTLWVHPSDYHITLRFLGGFTKASAASMVPAFALPLPRDLALELRAPGSFTQAHHKAILYIGLAGVPSALQSLQQQLEERAQALGLPAESRPFHPHVTVGRVHGEAASRYAEAWEREQSLGWEPILFNDYRMMKRISGAREEQDHAMYETIATYKMTSGLDSRS